MNRIQFMTELAELLQDISVEERIEAMKYYNDYFDEAGEENEEDIVKELGSPERVAAEVKAGLGETAASTGEFRETGYTDTRFERKATPSYSGEGNGWNHTEQNKELGDDRSSEEKNAGWEKTQQQGSGYDENHRNKNTGLKIVLIILVLVVGSPVILPVALAIICTMIAIILTIVCLFAGLVIASVMVALLGVVLVGAGIASLIPQVSAGLVLIGGGLITFVIGLVMTVAMVRACIIVLPGFFRGIINLIRKPFHGRKAVA